ncbi:MAG: tryptophan--tRNA ligase [Actinomycetota bacterium]
MRIFSGIQPSGTPHLGNYLGAIKSWVETQNSEAYFCVVDLHSLTMEIDPETLRNQRLELSASLIACGLDPEVCTLFVQSEVPFHAQLNWLLECVASYGELTRMVAFKDKSSRQEAQRASLLTYPVLMAADILLYDTDRVPVGDDQKQHLELTRVIAERFNNRYGQTFVIPEFSKPAFAARVMDLQDPTRKMSKSVSSPLGKLEIFDSPAEIEKKIKKAITDTDGEMRYDWELKPGLANLLDIYASFAGETPAQVASKFTRYGDFKTALAQLVIESLAPIAERYNALMTDRSELERLMTRGAEKASSVSEVVYARAATAMGLN